MSEKKRPSAKTIFLTAAGVAAAGAAAYGCYKLYRWSKDEYAARFWVELGPLGIRVSKTDAPNNYVVDICFGNKKEEIIPEEGPVQEMELPLDALADTAAAPVCPAAEENKPENEPEA